MGYVLFKKVINVRKHPAIQYFFVAFYGKARGSFAWGAFTALLENCLYLCVFGCCSSKLQGKHNLVFTKSQVYSVGAAKTHCMT